MTRSIQGSGKHAHGFLHVASRPHNLTEVVLVRRALEEDLPPSGVQLKQAVAKQTLKEERKAKEVEQLRVKEQKRAKELAAAMRKATGDAIRQAKELRDRQRKQHGSKEIDPTRDAIDAFGDHLATTRLRRTVEHVHRMSLQKLRQARHEAARPPVRSVANATTAVG